MTNILEIYEEIHSNYETFLVTKNPGLLAANIRLYERVDQRALKSFLATAMAHQVEECNQALLIIGKSYIAYALAMKASATRKECFQQLKEADECYKIIGKYTRSFPHTSMTPLLSNQLMEAVYRKEEIKFRRAEIFFHYAKNSPQVVPEALKKIIIVGKSFSALLKKSYKDEAIQQQLGFDNKFISYVDELISDAMSLLENRMGDEANVPKRKSPPQPSPQVRSKEVPKSIVKKRRIDELQDSASEPSTNTDVGLDRIDATDNTSNTQERASFVIHSTAPFREKASDNYPTKKSWILSRFFQFQPPPASVDNQEEFVSTYEV
ncbi:hypothetical protein [Legionella feeleii]|uniref:BRO1 domain-containing protein n=1 Tax=Legionella feeleii TaxID=453 RepID=A0A378ISW6_9GAMM|nr:hypothetical protein [Legionella feeleii]STX38338.1 Uncharacterised protein [Legionella feeleii]